MTTTNEQRAAARRLILAITRGGFSQLRKTSNGWLYGSGTFRMEVPYAVVQGSASLSYVAELHQRFDAVKSQRDAEFGKPAPRPEDMPVMNPEDLLKEDMGDLGGGPPGEGAPEGSTPSTPATEATGRGAETANLAVVGSTPTSLPTPPHSTNPEGETTMAKRRKDGKKMPAPWTCPKCGQTFGQKGRHEKACTGKQDTSTIATRKAVKQIVKVKAVPPSNGSTMEAIIALQSAFNQLMENVKLMDGELRTYRRENEELRAFKQRASALFEDGPKVPRG